MLTCELRQVVNHFLKPQSHPSRPRQFFNRYFSSTRQFNLQRILILGLESSADDTCASIISSSTSSTSTQPEILSNIVLKQSHLHEQHGGIHPLHAQHAHSQNMPLAIESALEEAKVEFSEIDAIGFTRGPGMLGCLGVAATSAKALAAVSGKKLIGVHHMQAHALTPFLTERNPPKFPFLTLLVSGGHTLLLYAESETQFKILATTHDESIGASFDKASRDLKIPWSLGAGSPGAALESFSQFNTSPSTFDAVSTSSALSNTNSTNSKEEEEEEPLITFAHPFKNELAFSFSGARSQLNRILLSEPVSTMSNSRKKVLAKSFMKAGFDQIEEKIEFVLKDPVFRKVEAVVASGGVASNSYLRKRLRQRLDSIGRQDVNLVFPPPHLCTDNAAMIANVALSRFRRGRFDRLDVQPIAKWSIEECEKDFE